MSEAPDRESDLANHPGRPRGRDELDPELLVLPRPGPRIGPLLALSVLVFCAYFLVRLWSDLVFAHRGDDPVQVKGVAGALAAADDSYVELDAVPDRAAIMRVYASEAREGHRLAPVLGSNDRLWILFAGSHWSETPAYDERVRGRIKQLDDLPFHEELAAQLARTRLPRALDIAAALAALPTGGVTELRDQSGDPVAIAPDTAVTVVQRGIGEARVTGFASDRQPDEKAWRAALEQAGLIEPGRPLDGQTDASWSWRVAAPDGVEPVAARLVAAKLFAARAETVDRTMKTVWRDLRVERGALVVAAGGQVERVTPEGIRALLVEAVHRAPDDARVLVTTDRPDDYHHVILLYVVLSVLTLVFAWALWRGLRAAPERAAAITVDEKGDDKP
jgi:hypothetical protein